MLKIRGGGGAPGQLLRVPVGWWRDKEPELTKVRLVFQVKQPRNLNSLEQPEAS